MQEIEIDERTKQLFDKINKIERPDIAFTIIRNVLKDIYLKGRADEFDIKNIAISNCHKVINNQHEVIKEYQECLKKG